MAEGHIRIDFLYTLLKGRPKYLADLVIHCMGFSWSSILMWQGSKLAWHSLITQARSSEAMMWPLFPSQVTVPIGLFFLSAILLGKIVQDMRLLVKGEN
jgi:TRAP-type mannitol/chloroaromatic compound transport system permease small subunit